MMYDDMITVTALSIYDSLLRLLILNAAMKCHLFSIGVDDNSDNNVMHTIRSQMRMMITRQRRIPIIGCRC